MAKQEKENVSIHLENPYEDENVLIHFAGDITFNRYSEIGYHTNPGYEICLIPNGKGFFKLHDKIYPISGKQLFITKAPQYHDGWPSKENPFRILYVCFYIKENCSSPLWKQIHDRLETIDFPVANEEFRMEDFHRCLIGEILEKKQFSSELILSFLFQFITFTLRNFEASGLTDKRNKDGGLKNLMSSRIIHFIDEHLFDGIDLEAISLALNYSISYVCRIFKNQTGFTVMEYYNFARLEKAKKLLVETQDSISEISEKLNFNSIHHFSNAFKELYSTSPLNYRKQVLKPEGS